jgi:hypothetical protein
MSQNNNFSMARKPKKRAPLDNLTKGLLLAFAVVGILLALLDQFRTFPAAHPANPGMARAG